MLSLTQLIQKFSVCLKYYQRLLGYYKRGTKLADKSQEEVITEAFLSKQEGKGKEGINRRKVLISHSDNEAKRIVPQYDNLNNAEDLDTTLLVKFKFR